MITQDDLDWVLKMAEDELEHLRQDADEYGDCLKDYIRSLGIFERVQEYLTTEGRINDHTR